MQICINHEDNICFQSSNSSIVLFTINIPNKLILKTHPVEEFNQSITIPREQTNIGNWKDINYKLKSQ